MFSHELPTASPKSAPITAYKTLPTVPIPANELAQLIAQLTKAFAMAHASEPEVSLLQNFLHTGGTSAEPIEAKAVCTQD